MAKYKPPTAEQVRKARKKHKLTQEQAAALLCMKVRGYRNYELGVSVIPEIRWRTLKNYVKAPV